MIISCCKSTYMSEEELNESINVSELFNLSLDSIIQDRELNDYIMKEQFSIQYGILEGGDILTESALKNIWNKIIEYFDKFIEAFQRAVDSVLIKLKTKFDYYGKMANKIKASDIKDVKLDNIPERSAKTLKFDGLVDKFLNINSFDKDKKPSANEIKAYIMDCEPSKANDLFSVSGAYDILFKKAGGK